MRVTGADRPSDQRVEDELIIGLGLRLDEFAEQAGQVAPVRQVDLLFDEADEAVAGRYRAQLQRTRNISHSVSQVHGWDRNARRRVSGTITSQASVDGMELDPKFIGDVRVIGKDHPLVLAVDFVANDLWRRLSLLPPHAPLHAPSSVDGWALAERVFGLGEGAMDDLL